MQIEFRDVSYQYQKGTPFAETALEGLNCVIPERSFVTVLGKTGSGKTTALQLLKGLVQPASGEIHYRMGQGEDAVVFSTAKRSKEQQKRLEQLWNRIGYLFQYPEHQLFEETVEKDIAYGPKNLGIAEETIATSIRAAMKAVNLDYDQYADRSPFALSGGQMRRVAFAGVLAMQPDILILDEPMAGLDPGSKEYMLNTIHQLHQERNLTTICVSHHLDELWRYTDYFMLFDGGKTVFTGSREQLLHAWQDRKLSYEPPSIVQLAIKLQKAGMIQQPLQDLLPHVKTDATFAKYVGQLIQRRGKGESSC